MDKKPLSNLLYWALLAAAALYFAYFKGWILADFESITPQQARELLQHESNVTVLDVRTPEEFAQGHIEGATLIPVQVLENELSKLASVKEKQIVVYCRSGGRSVAASRILTENGFVVLNMRGGIGGWKDEGYPLITP